VKGDVPPASDEVNRILAVVTGGDPDALIIAGYKEKAPAKIRDLLDQADNITALINKYIESLVEAMTDENGCIDPFYRNLLLNGLKETGMEIENEDKFLNYDYQVESLLQTLEMEAKLQFLTLIAESLIGSSKQENPAMPSGNNASDAPIPAVLRVPLLTRVQANQPGFIKDEHIQSWFTFSNAGNYRDGELFLLKVQDDAMKGSRILSGDTVLVKIQSTVQNGEIALVHINEQDAVLRRVKKLDDAHFLLYPDNPRYEPIIQSAQHVRICGKVIYVSFDPSLHAEQETPSPENH
jgi:SOS-response transcriptional repressor LexA